MHDLIIRRIPVGGRELLRLDAGLELKKEKQGLFFYYHLQLQFGQIEVDTR